MVDSFVDTGFERGSSFRRVPVLVADADGESRMALRRILDFPEYEVVEATSGAQALRRLLEQDFAVLLVDLELPEITAAELASLVASRPRSAGMQVVYLADLEGAEDELRELATHWGGIEVLVKPLVPGAVLSTLGIHVKLALQRAALEEQAMRIRRTDELEKELALRRLERASERRYRSLADAVPNIVWTSDPDGNVDYYNRRWFEFSKISVREGAQPWTRFLHPDDRERCLRDWERSLAEESDFEGEYRLRRGDGAYRWHLCRAMPERGPSGRVVSWLGTFTDITDQKRAERERERLYREAVEALRARDEFVSEASHELRTPVTSLGLLLQTLLRGLDRGGMPAERVREKLRAAHNQVDKLEALIRQLLNVSRMKSGPIELEVEEVDLGGLVEEIAARFEEDARQAGSSLAVSTEEGLLGKWDRLRLDQAITNLLTNALKFGAGKPIEFEVRREGELAKVKVRDYGVGIPPSDQERIFDRFVRSKTAKPFGGMGLGLYIVRQIVDAHGGSLAVESEPGEGATFILSLPL